MKVDAKALFEVVRQVVQDEVRKVLPEMVRQHLSESYVKKIVQETRGSPNRQPTMRELLTTPKEDELEEIPQPLENNDQGIYTQGMMDKKDGQNEAVAKLLSRNNPLSFVYEGVKIPGDEEVGPPSIPLEKVGFDFSTMNKLVEGMERRAPTRGEMSTNDMKIKELEAKRKALEVKVG